LTSPYCSCHLFHVSTYGGLPSGRAVNIRSRLSFYLHIIMILQAFTVVSQSFTSLLPGSFLTLSS
jgi:hypothetical protein